MTYWQALVLAIVEGLTEFLPVSSTGHMIIASQLLGVAPTAFTKLFIVGIQFGAILSVLVVYHRRFLQSFRPLPAAGETATGLGRLMQQFDFYFKLLVAFVPIAVAGLLLKHKINELLESVTTVAVALLVGGVVLVFIDKLFPQEDPHAGGHPVTTPGYRAAALIGLFQCLALVPGVSRSAATIIGGLSQKLTRRAAAEFAFFLTVPTMGAATVKELYDYVQELHEKGIALGQVFSGRELALLLLGNAVAFVVALLVLKPFVGFVARFGFRAFGLYRVIVGGLLLLLLGLGVNLQLV